MSVHSFLVKRHFPAALYHGAMDQQDRETAIDMFANGTSPILVATDLAARGLAGHTSKPYDLILS